MKKLTKLFSLSLVLIFSIQLLASCKENKPGSENSNTENVYNQLLSVYKDDALRDSSVKRESVTLNKKYTLDGVTTANYPDDGKKLTDGIYSENGTNFTNPELANYVGAKVQDTYSITIDLGGPVQGICDFELSGIRYLSNSSNVAKTVEFYISTDGSDYKYIGTTLCSDAVTANTEYVHTLKLQNTVEASFIKVVAKGISSNYSMIDEVAAYKYVKSETPIQQVDNETSNDYYKNEELKTVDTPVYWDKSESDYNTEQNLLSGRKARIYSTLPLDKGMRTDYYNAQTTSGDLLTNGIKGGSGYSDTEYFHFTQGYARSIIFDLDKTSTVSAFTFGCNANSGVGIGVASNIIVSVSENGKDWMSIFDQKYSSSVAADRVELSGNFDGKYKARFVKFMFQLGSAHTWVDEITVTGTKAIADGAKDVVPNGESTGFDVNKYADPKALGAENILLTYTFKNENKDAGLNTKDELLPYVAYYDNDGKMKDTFFDGFLFLACSTTCPSGAHIYHDDDKPAISTDWIAYYDDLFYKDCNVNGLQAAVSEVKTTLGLSDYKAKVFLPIYATTPTQKNFGDIDGDGVSEDFSKIEDRKKAHKWWIDMLIKRFKDGNYGDLELAGFYWNDEAIYGASDVNEEEDMKFVNEYVHSFGYKYMWIPYYMSTGFANWKEYGFDAATMQPNYMFSKDAPESRCDDNAKMTKFLGMGVEIEADGSVIKTAEGLAKYRKYLSTGVKWGYMNSVKTYYQDAGPGIFYAAYKSTDPAIRSVYDDTYKYAKNKLTLELPDVKTTKFETTADKAVTGKLELNDDIYKIASAQSTISPKFGTLKLNKDSFEYTPVSGFTGTDTFEITVSCGIGVKTVKITVEVK